jgi:nucleotide-binding universal stress UspA family protein
MKFKLNEKSGGVAIELGPKECQLPTPEGSSGQESIAVFSLKRILVPVDFSDCSKKALQYAVRFARQFSAELTLLHVVPRYPAVPEMGPIDLETVQDGRTQLEIVRLTIGDLATCHTLLRTGTPHMEIVEAAKAQDIDLIILATHGHKGLTRVLLGSTAERVVRQAPCPVLVVREKEREFLAKKLKESSE